MGGYNSEGKMRKWIILASLLLGITPAAAHTHRHQHKADAFSQGLGHGLIHMLQTAKQPEYPNTFPVFAPNFPAQPSPVSYGIVTVQTVVGIPITVASSLASRFQSLISDFAAHGYHPHHIGCFARGGHVSGSRHYAGAACDFDQTGWGRTVSFMYHARAIIEAHGFRDGCDFSDCGHVDDGQALGGGHRGRHHHYARRHRRHHHK